MKVITTELFIDYLVEEIEELSRVQINPKDDIKNLPAWNSINSLYVLARIQQEFGVEITIEEIRNSSTIDELVDLIRKKQNLLSFHGK